ncbi:unnamed protein product [Sphenostylis stenocarpa]|uniref:Uncharacterized protein n=1 Tax=Sphenostylis stenocarpa TaxID=92480 RepID=A0AA86SB96_9FABA|nr:unnamed protein product [Sphenostylis stenocarpa]
MEEKPQSWILYLSGFNFQVSDGLNSVHVVRTKHYVHPFIDGATTHEYRFLSIKDQQDSQFETRLMHEAPSQ